MYNIYSTDKTIYILYIHKAKNYIYTIHEAESYRVVSATICMRRATTWRLKKYYLRSNYSDRNLETLDRQITIWNTVQSQLNLILNAVTHCDGGELARLRLTFDLWPVTSSKTLSTVCASPWKKYRKDSTENCPLKVPLSTRDWRKFSPPQMT